MCYNIVRRGEMALMCEHWVHSQCEIIPDEVYTFPVNCGAGEV